ncbi:lantibiotic dehydratase [Kitasatospora sp. NBC_00085]|uniref:lantibiotic dehydratase n=1 Tax=unclassified Kitasatospora TaxID=2633591 RepID=UPI0032537193
MTHGGTGHPPVYSCNDTVLLRASALPASAADITRRSPDADPDSDAADVRAYVSGIVADPRVRGAVAAASASLAAAADRTAAGQDIDEARLRRVAGSLSRYLIRMSTRPTPFGLMAGVALARFDDEPTAHLGRRHRKAVRPDTAWLVPVLARWERRPDVWRHLRLTVNDLCFVRGDRLVLPYVPDVTGARAPTEGVTELTLRHTPAVAAALRHAEHPVPGSALAAHLADAFPQAPRSAVDGLIGQLVAHDILLTDLRPPDSDPDPLTHVITRLQAVPGFAELPALAAVRDALRAYGAAAPGEDADALRSAVDRMRTLQAADRPVHVDLAVDARVRLPTEVAREAERAADLLWRLAPGTGEPAHLRQYHAEFLERYGVGRLVPLKELLDPDVGLGAPAGYRHPRSGRVVHPEPADAGRRRDRVLAALVARAGREGAPELVLDDAAVERMRPSSDKPPLPSMELCGRIVADSTSALAAGEFTLWLSETSGSRLAGAMSGRFAHLLGPDAARLRAARAAGPDAPLTAQLSLQGAWLRAGNLTQVPAWLDHRIVVGGFADRGDPRVIGTADLAVCAWPDRLGLVSVALGREITPATFHMLNMRAHAPNLARFLQDVALSGYRSWEPWGWGRLDVLPALPRVRHGRTVLAPARWRTDEPFFDDARLGDARWRQALDAWRHQWNVPDHVLLADGDRYLQLDLSSAAHARILRQERGRSEAVLSEVPGGTAATGWLAGDEGAHSHEVVFPLAVRTPRAGTTDAPAGVAARRLPRTPRGASFAPRPPGSGWLYAKVYSTEQRQDEILTRHLPRLLEGLGPRVKRWFFVRYRDPAPHLRLRLYAGEPEQAGQLLPALGVWAEELRTAGLSGRMTLDTYDPEVERYGGPEAVALAEEVFQADSESVLAQLRARQERPVDVDPLLLTALNYLDILCHVNAAAHGGDGPAWLLETRPTHADRAVFRSHRQAAVGLADLDGRWEALAALPGGRAVVDSWARRAGALTRYGGHLGRPTADFAFPPPTEMILSSVLHMHHNRLVGIDREAEQRSHAVARGAVQAVLDKRRFAR